MSEGRETETDTERDRDRGREERLRPSGRKTERGKKKELGVEMSINQFTVANHNVSGLKGVHKGRQSSKCPGAITQEGKGKRDRG